MGGKENYFLCLPELEIVLEEDKSRHACKENIVAGT